MVQEPVGQHTAADVVDLLERMIPTFHHAPFGQEKTRKMESDVNSTAVTA